jgi:hypothetical protein
MQSIFGKKLLLLVVIVLLNCEPSNILTLGAVITSPADALPGIVALAGDGDRSGFRERTLDSCYIGGHCRFE